MSCYFRGMKDVLAEAGIEVTSKNKKQLDQAIHQIVGVTYKSCPSAWRKVKEQIRGDAQSRKALVEQLRAFRI